MRLNQRVTFFGASVTAQNTPNGYFDLVKAGIESQGGLVSRFAYGSCHFDDAGFHCITELNREVADVCVIEWNTTGLSRFHPAKVAVAIDHLLRQSITPIFLILCQARNLRADRDCESQVYAWCKEFQLPLIDLRPSFPGMHLLRDNVHTTSDGAKYYAEKILAALQGQHDVSTERLNSTRTKWAAVLQPGHVQFGVANDSLVLEEGKIWKCEFSRTPPLSELVFDLTIGPDSPLLEVTIGNHQRTLSIWDSWCHYDRRKLVTIVDEASFSRSGEHGFLTLRVLPDKPNYSQCRRQGFDYGGLRRLRVIRSLTSNLELAGVNVS